MYSLNFHDLNRRNSLVLALSKKQTTNALFGTSQFCGATRAAMHSDWFTRTNGLKLADWLPAVVIAPS